MAVSFQILLSVTLHRSEFWLYNKYEDLKSKSFARRLWIKTNDLNNSGWSKYFFCKHQVFFAVEMTYEYFLKSDIITVTYHKKSFLKDISPLVDTRRKLNNRKIFLWSPGCCMNIFPLNIVTPKILVFLYLFSALIIISPPIY